MKNDNSESKRKILYEIDEINKDERYIRLLSILFFFQMITRRLDDMKNLPIIHQNKCKFWEWLFFDDKEYRSWQYNYR